MKRFLSIIPKEIATVSFIFLLSFIVNISNAQSSPPIDWQKALGGTGDDVGNFFAPTTDGGFIVVGYSNSNNGDVSGNHGNNDGWVAKLTSTGAVDWQKSIGGSQVDEFICVSTTSDGGYILAGSSSSSDGDITTNKGDNDALLVKLTSTGTISWQKTYGGSAADVFRSVEQTIDGGYIAVGYTASSDFDVVGQHGGGDIWAVKLDNAGNITWQKPLGGIGLDYGYNIKERSDGSFFLSSYTMSGNSGDVTGHHGLSDGWIVKLSSAGNIDWQRALGGNSGEGLNYVIPTVDGGCIAVGNSGSPNGDVSVNLGGSDLWIVKLTSTGTLDWEKSIGGTNWESGYHIESTTDGGYIITGYTESNDIDVSGYHGGTDGWLVKINNIGVIEWQKCLGGTGTEFLYNAEQLTDGSFATFGYTNSNNGDVTGNHGATDYWLVKLASTPLPVIWNDFTVSQKENVVNLVWKVDKEINVKEYAAQKSTDGRTFKTIAYKTPECNGCNAITRYEAADENLVSGKTYYRILQTDKDGKQNYSVVKSIFINDNKIAIDYVRNSNAIMINGLDKSKQYAVKILTVDGKTIAIHKGFQTDKFIIHANALPAGNYIISISSGTEINISKSIIIMN